MEVYSKLILRGSEAEFFTNVGIGASPGANLDVAGGQFHLGTNGASDIYMSPDDTNQVIRFSKSAGGNLDILSNGGVIHLNLNGNVGIGTGSPSSLLHLKETDGDANAGPILTLQRDNSASEDNGDILGEIQFQGSDSVDTTTTEYSTIHSKISNVSHTVEEGTIVFKNMVAGTSTEVMTLKGSALGIGTGDAVDEELHVEKSQNTLTRIKIENTNTGSLAQAQTNYVSDKHENKCWDCK